MKLTLRSRMQSKTKLQLIQLQITQLENIGSVVTRGLRSINVCDVEIRVDTFICLGLVFVESARLLARVSLRPAYFRVGTVHPEITASCIDLRIDLLAWCAKLNLSVV